MSFLICFWKLATGTGSKTYSWNKFSPNKKKKNEKKDEILFLSLWVEEVAGKE